MAIEEKLKLLPSSPGVYIMKGTRGEVLYVGKARELKGRVRSYFRESTIKSDSRYAVRFLATRTADIDYIVTTNETEALILEDTLLKKYKPRYNIRLKDDKTYLSIKITLNEEFPRIFTTRRIKKDGARYFGPYASASAAKETLKILRRIFPLCVCSASAFRNMRRPCLDYQLGLCTAPAVGLISKERYAQIVSGAILMLEGKNRQLIKTMKADMKEASDRLDFESAAMVRDRLSALTATLEEQKVVSPKAINQDIIAVARDDKSLAVQILPIREGRLVGSKSFTFKDTPLPTEEILSSFLTQYYSRIDLIPDAVVLPTKPMDATFIENWLGEKKGRKVRLIKPVRGLKLKLLKMAKINALESLKKNGSAGDTSERTEALQKRLKLKIRPRRIEAFDISNIGATNAVGAMVSFLDGQPDKANYRRFKIKDVSHQDDYAMIREVLLRRYSRASDLPDLIVIDGGKGQLAMALSVLDELSLSHIQSCSLAKGREHKRGATARLARINKIKDDKNRERVYLPNVKDPIFLKEGLKADLYLRLIRDEVHRFAISYHRKLRGKTIGSALDLIPGIGEKKRRVLLTEFGDIKGVKKATIEDLTRLPGFTAKLARIVKNNL